MKILFISSEGDGFSLALALQRSGNDVKVYCKEKRFQYAMGGLLTKVSSYRPQLKWADLVIIDMVGLGSLAKELTRAKIPFLGANLVADVMELDRGKQMQAFKKFNIQLPPTYPFSDPGSAKRILSMWSSPGYVIKPSGNLNTASTRLCKTPEEYTWALEQYSTDQELIVQKILEGVEVSTEGWFDGEQWVHFNHTFEEKRFLDGNLGQNVGCMGNIVVEGSPLSSLSKEVQKLTPLLKSAGYRGPIDLNMIVNENGPHTLEATPRLGYDAIEALWSMSKDGLGQFLLSVAKNQGQPLPLTDSFGAAVRLSIPPYPMEEPSATDRGRPVYSPSSDLVLWSDVYQEKNQLYWSAGDGVLAKVVSSGSDSTKAAKGAYDIAEKVKCPDLQYRTDIGSRVPADLSTLEQLGVL